jgi:hypothetical protein
MQRTRRGALLRPSLGPVLRQWPLREAAEVLESSNTRWRESLEKLSHSSEVRVAFRDASGRSESALSGVADGRVDVVEGAVMDEVVGTSRRTRREGSMARGEMECRGRSAKSNARPCWSEHPFNTRSYFARHCNRNTNVFGLVLIL